VRVISGVARGRTLRAAPETRPTADLIKGAIFSMLEALAYKRGFEPDNDGNLAAALAWPRVLDLFAGAGGLGIEALSRGAEFAEFVDQDREAVRVIHVNLRATGLDERARVHHSPVEVALRRLDSPVGLVFVDPPYEAAETLQTALETLGQSRLILPSSVVVVEQSAEADPPPRVGQLELTNTRRHGRTRISLFSAEARPPGC
jgi:16S rRNA (guanine966-N2)-methyltransferase